MHRFIQPQTFNVRPIEHAGVLIRQALWIEQRLKSHVSRRRKRIDLLEQGTQRKSDPGNYHRPTLNTAMAIDALLGRRKLYQVIEVESPGLIHQTADFYSPRFRDESA